MRIESPKLSLLPMDSQEIRPQQQQKSKILMHREMPLAPIWERIEDEGSGSICAPCFEDQKAQEYSERHRLLAEREWQAQVAAEADEKGMAEIFGGSLPSVFFDEHVHGGELKYLLEDPSLKDKYGPGHHS